MTRNFVDYHCHLLPALDDGAVDARESLRMARILAQFGFSAVHCTPHRIKGCYENDPERVARATGLLQDVLDQSGIALRLVPGTEHYLDEFLIDQLPGALTAGSSRCLLVEVPFGSTNTGLLEAVAAGLQDRGLAPLFAHPERCRAFDPALGANGGRGLFSYLGKKRMPEMEGALVLKLRAAGCRFQGNLGSFAGFYGGEVRERALLFLRHGVYSCVGSDAHRSEDLAAMLSAGYEAVLAEVGAEAADRLLAGSDLAP
jgi:protein-tyrosine phosphatase